jgi:hypothetical protein
LRRKTCFLSITVLFVLLALPLIANVRASSSAWTQTYGGDDYDSVEAVIQTSDGGYALTGRTRSFGSGSNELWIIKTDSFGNMEWNKTYGAGSSYAIVQTSEGGYTIAGSRLIKTDSEGNIQWNRSGGFTSMIQTSDGGYALAGYTNLVMGESADFWLVKTDETGYRQWSKTYPRGAYDQAKSVIQTSDGGYAITGFSRYSAEGGDYFLLIKTDQSGEIEWSRKYGSQDKDEGHVVAQTGDGGYLLAGLMWNRSGSGIAGVIKTDSAGNVEWAQNYLGGIVWSMALTDDEGFIIGLDNVVIKTDADGNIQWNATCAGRANSVIQTSDGGYAIAGTGVSDAFLAKLDPDIPEFPSWTILPLVAATALIAVYLKNKAFNSSRAPKGRP